MLTRIILLSLALAGCSGGSIALTQTGAVLTATGASYVNRCFLVYDSTSGGMEISCVDQPTNRYVSVHSSSSVKATEEKIYQKISAPTKK